MFYDFLQRQGISAAGVTIITDGIKKGEANLLAAVFSGINEQDTEDTEGIENFTLIYFPGGDPAANNEYHGLSCQEYRRMNDFLEFDNQLKEIQIRMEKYDIILTYSMEFLKRFLEPEMFSVPWNIVDAAVIPWITPEMYTSMENSEDTGQALLDTCHGFNRSPSGGSWKQMSRHVRESTEQIMGDHPVWEQKHNVLIKTIQEL